MRERVVLCYKYHILNTLCREGTLLCLNWIHVDITVGWQLHMYYTTTKGTVLSQLIFVHSGWENIQ